MGELLDLFRVYSEQDNPPVIVLENKVHQPVGALYLDRLKYNAIAISENKISTEKYLLYFQGVAIYFSYFHKLEKNQTQ